MGLSVNPVAAFADPCLLVSWCSRPFVLDRNRL